MTPTQSALRALRPGEVVASTLAPSLAQRAVDGMSRLLSRTTSRRGLLFRAGVVGSAMALDPFGYVLRPGTAYAAVCGPGTSCGSGWTVFCATINKGVNACPPGSIAAGWWKADGASLCGGSARYIIDCNATCSRCSSPGARAGICSSSCWSCGCTCGPTSSCDQRKVCCNAFRYGQCNTQVRQVGGVHCRVVSCTPPWEFENCTTSPATDNRTRDHNSDALPQAWTPVAVRYKKLGENGSVLGATVYGELAFGNGRAQRYQNGRISYHSITGAWETVGPIARRYEALKAETGLLGYPVSGQVVLTGGNGRASRFQKGRITYHPVTGAWETVGPIAQRFEALKAEVGVLAYPVSGQVVLAGGTGRASRFQKGRITYHPVTGAWETLGPIAQRFEALKAEAGVLAYPVAAPIVLAGGTGRASRFQKGRITSHPETGTWETVGPIATRYEAIDAEAGPLGYPVAAQLVLAGGTGRASRFQKGRLTYHPVTGAWETVGAVATLFERLGAEAGPLAYPVSATVATGSGVGTTSTFQKGRISAHPQLGAFATLTQIAERYAQEGAEDGVLGFPTAAETTLSDGRRQSAFQRGTITYDPAAGTTNVELSVS